MKNRFCTTHCLSKDFPILDFLVISAIVKCSLALSEHVLVDMGRPSQKNNQLNLNYSTFSSDYHHFTDLLRWGAGGAGAGGSGVGWSTKLTNIIPQNIPIQSMLRSRLRYFCLCCGSSCGSWPSRGWRGWSRGTRGCWHVVPSLSDSMHSMQLVRQSGADWWCLGLLRAITHSLGPTVSPS